MSNYPLSFEEEPAREAATDYANLEAPEAFSDETAAAWDFLGSILNTPVEAATNSLPPEDVEPDYLTALADLERRMEANEANENTIERYLVDDQLHEEQELLLAEGEIESPPELDAAGDVVSESLTGHVLPSRDELVERATHLGLYDARFIGKDEVNENGVVTGQTVQALEIYKNTNGATSGKVLDVAHYVGRAEAEEDYFQLQSAVSEGDVPIYAVASLAEMVAQENGLDTVWRDSTPADLELYQQHLRFDSQAGVPPPDADMDRLANGAIAIADAERGHAVLVQDAVEQQQAVDALMATGLQPPEDFSLHRDSYLDDETGKRYIAGIFQTDLANETSGCQATLVELGRQADGLGQQARVVPIGIAGSYDAAYRDWSAVHLALNHNGISDALGAMEQIEAQISAAQAISDTPVLLTDSPQQAVETPEIERSEPEIARHLDIGGM